MSRFILAFTLLAFVFVPPALAQDDTVQQVMVEPVATVIAIEGDVAVKAAVAEDAAQLIVDAPVFEDDEILTGPDSKVMLLFVDDTELIIGENAAVKINDFTYEPEEDGKKTAYLTFARGAFLFVTGKIDKIKNPDVNLETPYGSIGIRGTVVWGGTLDAEEYNIFVKEGSVSVRNERGAMMVREGEGTSLTSRRTFPSKAKLWETPKINRAVATIALNDQEQATTMLESRRGKLLQDIQARRALLKEIRKEKRAPNDGNSEDEKLDKQGMLELDRDRQDKTGVNSNLKDKAEPSMKSRNKTREEEFKKRMKEERYNK